MTKSKWMLAVAIAVLIYGLAEAKTASAGEVQKDTVVAAEDASPSDAAGSGSAKMGQGEGTQPGDVGATKENDTQKVDQPPRRNPTTGDEGYGDQGGGGEAAPSDDDQDTDR